MNQINVLQPGLLTTLQDGGRTGAMFYGLSRSGAADKLSLGRANAILGKEALAAALECTLVPPVLEFRQACRIAIAGADMYWRVDGKRVDAKSSIALPAGSVLEGKPATSGFRAYIAVDGKFLADELAGSVATHTMAGIGGFDGKRLHKGQRLEWQPSDTSCLSHSPPGDRFTTENKPIEIAKGPEWHWLTARARRRLVSEPFEVQRESNRMGAQLAGPELTILPGRTMPSVPLLPGMVQLPPSGKPIVILQDGQTTGGYPRIAWLSEESLNRFNQLGIGAKAVFRDR